MTDMQLPSGAVRSLPKQQGMKSRMKNMKRADLGQRDDFGLMPKTFIRPANQKLPALLSSQWKHRIKIEWLYVQLRLQAFIA